MWRLAVGRQQRLALSTCAVALGMLWGAINSASAGAYSEVGARPPDFGRVGLVVAGSQAGDEIDVSAEQPTEERVLVSDPGGVNTFEGCTSLFPTVAACSRFGKAEVDGHGGPDTVEFGTGVVAVARLGPDDDTATLANMDDRGLGEAGDDSITGRAGDDAIVGGSGADRLEGGSGEDKLTGGDGRDSLAGGSERDVLLAADGMRDRRIDCGAGRDLAVVDGSLDPDPVGCERVRTKQPVSDG